MQGHFVLKGGMRRLIIASAAAFAFLGIALSASLAQRVQLGGELTHQGFQKRFTIDAKAGQVVRLRVHAAGGRPSILIYRSRAMSLQTVLDLRNRERAETILGEFVAPADDVYHVNITTGGHNGFTFSYLDPSSQPAQIASVDRGVDTTNRIPAPRGGQAPAARAPEATSGFGVMDRMVGKIWTAGSDENGPVYYTYRLDRATNRLIPTDYYLNTTLAEGIYYERAPGGQVRRVLGQSSIEVTVLADGTVNFVEPLPNGAARRTERRMLNDRAVQYTRETSTDFSRRTPTWTPASSRQDVAIDGAKAEVVSARNTPASASTVPPRGDRQYRTGETFRDCSTCPPMVVVPAGSFMMGSPGTEEGRQGNEGPRHMVTIANQFAIGQFEVTFEEYGLCVQDGGCAALPSDGGWGRGRRPVINVSWYAATIFTEWLSGKTGQRYFLPTEAEWEYAARAGTGTPWNTGEAIITEDANFLNQFARTVPVGGYPPNAFGLHDTHGNASEWVRDCYEVGYFGMPTDGGAMATPQCAARVVRGGGFDSVHALTRSATRGTGAPNGLGPGTGFRVARAL